MKLRPIPCYQHEVPAILEGRQTELRRPIKLPKGATEMELVVRDGKQWPRVYTGKGPWGWEWLECPFGVPFDELWIQETWADVNTASGPSLCYRADGAVRTWSEFSETFGADYGAGPSFDYDAYGGKYTYTMWWEDLLRRDEHGEKGYAWRPSVHMPIWASRGRLVIDAIGAERVQEITPTGAWAEGCRCDCMAPVPQCGGNYLAFKALWDSINAKRGYGWEKNPPVWVVKFHLKG